MPNNISSLTWLDKNLTAMSLMYFACSPALVYISWLLGLTFPSVVIFTLIMIAVFPVRIVSSINSGIKINHFQFLVYLSLFLILASFIYGISYRIHHFRNEYLYQTVAMSLLFPLYVYTIASNFRIQNKNFINILKYSWLILFCTVAFGVAQAYSKTGNYFLYFRNWEEDQTFNYQVMADMLALISLLLLPNIKTLRSTFFIASASAIFLSYSRSAFICFAIASFIILLISKADKQKTRFNLTILLFQSLFLIALLLTSIDISSLSISLSRFEFIFGSEDASIEGRSEIFYYALDNIEGTWFFGELLYEVRQLGEGRYLHNILSYLLSYGILTFIIVLFLLIYSLIVSLRNARRSEIQAGVAAVMIFATLSIFFFRSHVWYLLWFALGLAGSVNISRGYPNQPLENRRVD